MAAAFAGFIGMPGVEEHNDGGEGIGRGEEEAVLDGAEVPGFQAGGEKGHAAVGGGVVEKVDEDHDENFATQEALPEGEGGEGGEFGGFTLEGGFEVLAFGGGNPFGFAGVIADEVPPDGEPEEGEAAFGDEHGLPAAGAEEPAGDGGGGDNGEGLTEVPTGVGAGAFLAGEPVGEEDDGGRKDAAFGDAEEEAHGFKLGEGAGEAAADGTNAPKEEAEADPAFGAPTAGEVAAGDLQ